MNYKPESEIEKVLMELRSIAESRNDLVEVRLAQAMETGIQWAICKFEDNPSMVEEIESIARILKRDLSIQ